MASKTYLITGAAGFIGAAVSRNLIEKGNTVITIDNLKTGFKENLPKGIVFIQGDCAADNIIEKLNDYQFDAILHIAGQSSGEISFDDPSYDLKTNTLSTVKLLKFAIKNNCKKFIYASTMSVYGENIDERVNEDAILNPISFYAVGKIASEQYLKIYSLYGLTCTSLRMFNVYGPGQNMSNLRQGMVSIFLEQALNGKVVVKGDLNRFRDFIYIDDVANAIIESTKFDDIKYRVMNIGTGTKTTVKSLLNEISKNIPDKLIIEQLDSTPGDQYGIYADISYAKKIMDWYPITNLSDGIRKFINHRLKKIL